MDPRQPSAGYASYSYLLELKGKVLAGFSTCVGLHSCGSNGSVSEFCRREVNSEDVLILEGGSTDSLYIWEWYSRMLGGKPRKEPLTIVQKNDAGEETRWKLTDAWPIKWDGQALSRDECTITINALEISHLGAEKKR